MRDTRLIQSMADDLERVIANCDALLSRGLPANFEGVVHKIKSHADQNLGRVHALREAYREQGR